MKPHKPLVIPAFGVIKGGRLDGWAYHFLHFRVDVIRHGDPSDTVSYELRVVARCSPPGWPFPHDIALDSTHYMQLRAVPGSRAKRKPLLPLVESAYHLASCEMPPALARILSGEQRSTLRAAAKRGISRQRKAR